MATDGPRLQKILAKSRQIFHIRTRAAFRALIAAKNSLFLTRFPDDTRVAKKWDKLITPYPRLEFGGGTLQW